MKIDPEAWEALWSAFDSDLGAKGSKKKALEYFKKKKQDAYYLIDCLERQQIARMLKKEAKGWAESFPHVFRWIRDERWNDE